MSDTMTPTPVPEIVCPYCKDELPITDAHEIPMPMDGGNPYPEPLYSCRKADCMKQAETEAEAHWRDAEGDVCDDCGRIIEECICSED